MWSVQSATQGQRVEIASLAVVIAVDDVYRNSAII
jgi:hypothetical protein